MIFPVQLRKYSMKFRVTVDIICTATIFARRLRSYLQCVAVEEKRQQQQQVVGGRRTISFYFKYPRRTERIIPELQRAAAVVETNELEFKNILDDDDELGVRYNRDPKHLRRPRDR